MKLFLINVKSMTNPDKVYSLYFQADSFEDADDMMADTIMNGWVEGELIKQSEDVDFFMDLEL